MILTDANAGSHKFRIVVNPQHAIAETDFTNNTSPTLDVVVPAGYCTLGYTNANTAQETATAQGSEGKLPLGPPIAAIVAAPAPATIASKVTLNPQPIPPGKHTTDN